MFSPFTARFLPLSARLNRASPALSPLFALPLRRKCESITRSKSVPFGFLANPLLFDSSSATGGVAPSSTPASGAASLALSGALGFAAVGLAVLA